MPEHRVLIDGYYLGKPSGYGRFGAELCRALGGSGGEFEFLVAVPEGIDEDRLTPYERLRYVRMRDSIFPLWEQIALPECALRNRCSIIHFPFNTRAVAPGPVKTVTTVHDLTFLNARTERDIKSSLIHLYMMAVFYSGTVRSNAIIAVSDTTKQALADKRIRSKRIYNTVDGFIGTPVIRRPAASSRPYLLHRGSYAAGHRNTGRIIKAFLSRPELVDNYELKIFGVPEGAAHWHTTSAQPIEYLKRVTDEELASLYWGSACVVAASLLEGFCLPIVEAFGFGVPVVTSNLNPMMEIAGDAALLVSPDNIDEIAQAMLTVVSDRTLAQRLVGRGKARLKEFSSDRMAEQLIDTYERVLGRDRKQGRWSAGDKAVSMP